MIEELLREIAGLRKRLERLEVIEGGLVKLDEKIAGAGGSASFDFTNISQAFRHLRIELYARSDDTVLTSRSVRVQFNGDGGANYDFQRLIGSAAVAGADEFLAQSSGAMGEIPASNVGVGANLFGQSDALIAYYTQATNNKMLTVLSGRKLGTASGNMLLQHVACFWRSNAAITQVALFPGVGNFAEGSIATLYGLP